MAQDAILQELRATGERVIAISLHNLDKPGMKGKVVNFDDTYVEFASASGKIETLPKSAYKFRRVEKEGGR